MGYDRFMARLTITLPDERHRQLRTRAAAQGTTIAALIEEDLQVAEAARRGGALAILERAWAHAEQGEPMADEAVMEIAVEETRAVRREMAEEKAARGR